MISIWLVPTLERGNAVVATPAAKVPHRDQVSWRCGASALAPTLERLWKNSPEHPRPAFVRIGSAELMPRRSIGNVCPLATGPWTYGGQAH